MVFRLAFVEGSTPDRWARTWRERESEPLELSMVDQAHQLDGVLAGTHDAVLARSPWNGGVRGPGADDERPPGLHLVRLYAEVQVVVAGRDHLVAAADEVELADLDEEQLVRPHSSGWRPGVEQYAFPEMSAREAVETVAAGTGIALLAMSVARLHARRDVVARPVSDLAATDVGLLWRVDDDGPRVQQLVGIVRGRRAGSSRG